MVDPAAAAKMSAMVAAGAAGGLMQTFDRFKITTSSFIFIVDGCFIGAFKSLSGMQVSIDEFEIEEGGNNESIVKRPGRMKWDNLVLTRGISTFDTLFSWINQVSGQGFSEKNTMAKKVMLGGLTSSTGANKFDAESAALILTDRNGFPLRSWWVLEAMPVRWKGPDFSAAAADEGVPIEELEISHQGIRKMDLF